MRIGIMLRHFGQPGGIGVYTANIVKALLEIDQGNHYTLFYRRPEQLGHFASCTNVEEELVWAPNKLLWDQVAIPRRAQQKDLDLLYNPKLSIPLFTRAKTVLTMHGGAQFVVPSAYLWYDRMYYTVADRLYCRRADAIITMTSLGAKDIAKHMGADAGRVFAIHESYNELCRPLEAAETAPVKAKHNLPDSYILFLGGINPLKNFGNIVRAFNLIKDRFHQHKLVAVGFKRWKYSKDLALIDQLGLRERILFTNFIPDEDIPAIYNLADVFVFPSIYEGFGIPALEAMACGTPVVASRTGCNPEVVRDAALQVDPFRPDEIAAAITRLLEDPTLRTQLKRKGLERARYFSWQKTAHETLQLFERVMPGKGAGS